MDEDADLWLLFGAVWGPILFGMLVLLLVGLWFVIGRVRDRRYLNRVRDSRCWKCNYELRGIASDRCPECGMPITRPWRSPAP
jgi:hypothetical protein